MSAFRQQPNHARSVTAYALWFGVVSGLLQVVALLFRKHVTGFSHQGTQFVWMVPLAEVGVLFVAAAGLSLIHACLRRALDLSLTIRVFAFLSVLSALLLPDFIAWWAATVLAIGVACAVARVATKHPADFFRVVRTTLPVMMLAILSAAATTNVHAALRARRLLNQLPRSRAGAPNIILFIWDTVRAQSVSLYNPLFRTTPNLAAFASHGVVFDNAIATAPWTLPSHASFMSGLYSHEFRAGWALPVQGKFPTLAEVLAANGYRTGAFVANLLYTDAEHGLGRGFLTYQDHRISIGEILYSSTLVRKLAEPRNAFGELSGPHHYLWHKSGETVDEELLRWTARDTGHPFFAFVNYFDAHDPYVSPKAFEQKMGAVKRIDIRERVERVIQRKGPDELSPQQGARQLKSYLASILYLDHMFGELLWELQRRGELQNTLIIVASDHGEEFGEHGAYRHGDNLYLTTLQVPLVLVGPGVPPDTHVTATVTLRDLPATVLDLAGVSSGPVLPGESWAKYWLPERGRKSNDSPVLSSTTSDWYGQRLSLSVVAQGRHYIQTFRGGEYLYDLGRDPGEQFELVRGQQSGDALHTFRALLDRVPRCPGGSRFAADCSRRVDKAAALR